MLSEFLIDAESLIEELVLIFLSYLCKLDSIVVIKSVDVVHHASLVSLDSG
jgi:hypothetical protein